MAKDHNQLSGSDQSLGKQASQAGGIEPAGPISLGEQPSGVGLGSSSDSRSLGDAITFGGASTEGPAEEVDELEIVDLSSRYKIEAPLGRGGMGEVSLALDSRLNRKVAIKRISGRSARDRSAIHRFMTEARSVAALNHPNIVQIYDYGRAEDGPFLIMEYVDGGSLADLCAEGPLPLDVAVELVAQLCEGLSKAHALGIVHRDIKPANVLITSEGVPKLTDFGLAKAEASELGITMAGAVLGTLDFMPPEQRRDAASVDARSDLWSLAATLYQMVTGRSPKVIKLNDVPRAIQPVLEKALEDDKDARYATARDLKAALNQALISSSKVQLETGECPHCGTQNEASRKFCKSCAGSLEVSCFNCDSSVLAWEDVCGNCGTRQSVVLEQRTRAMEEQRQSAETLLAEFKFKQAREVATGLGNQTDQRLTHLREWSVKFLRDIEGIEQEQTAQTTELIGEALKHEQASDYQASIHALNRVPAPQQEQTFADLAGLSASALSLRVSEKWRRSQELDQLIRERVRNRELFGLQNQVKELLELLPSHERMQKLYRDLQARDAKLKGIRDEASVAAKTLAAKGDFAGALKELARIDPDYFSAELDTLKEHTRRNQHRAEALRQQISMSLDSKQYVGLLANVEELLKLTPEDDRMQKLWEQVIAREAKSLSQVQALLNVAREYAKVGQFYKATTELGRVPAELVTEELSELRELLVSLVAARVEAMQGLAREAAANDLSKAKLHATRYLELLKRHNLGDATFEAEAEVWFGEIWQKRLLKLGMIAACVVLVVGVASYFAISSLMRTVAISRAMESGDYAEVLRLDPRNEAGLGLRKRAEAIAERLAAGDFDRELRLDSNNPEGLAMKDKSEAELEQKSEAISRALAAGDYEEVFRLDASKLPVGTITELPPITNSIGQQLKPLPPGKFLMGDANGVGNETPHEVTLTRAFYMGVHEVTQEQYERVMGTSPSMFKGAKNPVEHISWEDAVEFCKRLSAMPEEKKAGRVYRLPTEAEWEYACRAGSTTKFCFGDDEGQLGDYAWFSANSKIYSQPVGQKQPNAWGLYDMHGNVSEWCSDWYGTYLQGPVTDPVGPPEGEGRVIRGGSSGGRAEFCRSASRYVHHPREGSNRIGFRVALSCRPEQRSLTAERGSDVSLTGQQGHVPQELNDNQIVRVDRPSSESLLQMSVEELRQLSPAVVAGLPLDLIRKVSPNILELNNSIEMSLKLLPAGSYDRFIGGKLQKVTLTKAFYIGTYEVTYEQYDKVMGRNTRRSINPKNPVALITWLEAVEFCQRLSDLPEEKKAGRVYRLPTDAEWEYACRAGTSSLYHFGDDPQQLEEFAWFKDNSGGRTQPVGLKKPNAWGLHDIQGNVGEWCSDWHAELPDLTMPDPTGPATGTHRVTRGCGWSGDKNACRSTFRNRLAPTDRFSDVGFRVVVSFSGVLD